jgi:hypothetical protein
MSQTKLAQLLTYFFNHQEQGKEVLEDSGSRRTIKRSKPIHIGS